METSSVIFVLLRRMRAPLIVLILVFAIAVLGFVLIPGVDDKGQAWAMGFFHALYVVTYTATTIGFGELPYLFNDAQRLWMMITVYMTVIAWLYSIGALFSIFQDPVVRVLLRESRFRRAVRRIREPFYLICGYGDTGCTLVRALDADGLRSVVLDISIERINLLETEDLQNATPGLNADASKPSILLTAGLRSPFCNAVAALTNNDEVNLQITLTSQLLHPDIVTVARADSRYTAESLRSFGTHHVVSPFDTFAKILQHALRAPATHALYERLMGEHGHPLSTLLVPPRGRWIVCGYGRFGRTIHDALVGEGLTVQIIEQDCNRVQDMTQAIVGPGTDADTLKRAGVLDAVGLVAATDNDARNLAIVMTARGLNAKLFVISRQNERENELVFDAARLDMVMRHGESVAHEIYTRLLTPLMVEVLAYADQQDSEWTQALLSQLDAAAPGIHPWRWTLDVRSKDAPALSRAVSAGHQVTIGDLLRNPHDREAPSNGVALLLRRGSENSILPKLDEALHKGDSVLFCGDARVRRNVLWISRNVNILSYVLTGEERRGDWLMKQRAARRAAVKQP